MMAIRLNTRAAIHAESTGWFDGYNLHVDEAMIPSEVALTAWWYHRPKSSEKGVVASVVEMLRNLHDVPTKQSTSAISAEKKGKQ
jgi:hypothetical protein